MKARFSACLAALCLAIAPAAHASVVELVLTGSWAASDFDVSSTGTTNPSDPAEDNDDLVFGLAPSAGSISVTLLVDTSSVTSYLVGGPETVAHDHFGYTDVTLKDPVSLGTASWDTSDILTGLIGPGGTGASLWTDVDLTTGAPTLASFRMFGDWAGTGGSGTADMFFGSRILSGSGYEITDSFLAWEFYQGEEIRSSDYTAAIAPVVPLPASVLFLAAGLGGFAGLRRLKR